MPGDERKSVLIVEDHALLREGVRALLSSHPDLKVIGEAADGREAIRQVEKLSPDLVLMDLSMPRMGGVEAIGQIKKKWPDIKILALTVYDSEEYVQTALQAGADGYILKDSSHAELLLAIRSVLAGKRVLSPTISAKVIEGYLAGKKTESLHTPWETLTQREREVLKLIGEGNKSKEIADYLCISLHTVEKHRSNLMEKLNLHSVAALVSYAIEKGLVVK
ncbi:MAG: DNA-binding response regulator [Deltaproteobacteria bacterium]|jgi:two-component system response regulator NreC|nr:MAG: DNA-binding response regulator [Deltaproteobacteria bacterium]